MCYWCYHCRLSDEQWVRLQHCFPVRHVGKEELVDSEEAEISAEVTHGK